MKTWALIFLLIDWSGQGSIHDTGYRYATFEQCNVATEAVAAGLYDRGIKDVFAGGCVHIDMLANPMKGQP